MTWLRAALFNTFASIGSLSPLEMGNHITVGLQRLHTQMVPISPQAHVAPPTYTVHAQPQQVDPPTPAKKKTPEECWDLQSTALCQLTNVAYIENGPGI